MSRFASLDCLKLKEIKDTNRNKEKCPCVHEINICNCLFFFSSSGFHLHFSIFFALNSFSSAALNFSFGFPQDLDLLVAGVFSTLEPYSAQMFLCQLPGYGAPCMMCRHHKPCCDGLHCFRGFSASAGMVSPLLDTVPSRLTGLNDVLVNQGVDVTLVPAVHLVSAAAEQTEYLFGIYNI